MIMDYILNEVQNKTIHNFKSEKKIKVFQASHEPKTTKNCSNYLSESFNYTTCMNLQMKNSTFSQQDRKESCKDSNTFKEITLNNVHGDKISISQLQKIKFSTLDTYGPTLNLDGFDLKRDTKDKTSSYLKCDISVNSEKQNRNQLNHRKFELVTSNCGAKNYTLNDNVSIRDWQVGEYKKTDNIEENLSGNIMNLRKDSKLSTSATYKIKKVDVDKNRIKIDDELQRKKLNFCNNAYKDCLDDEIFEINNMFFNFLDDNLSDSFCSNFKTKINEQANELSSLWSAKNTEVYENIPNKLSNSISIKETSDIASKDDKVVSNSQNNCNSYIKTVCNKFPLKDYNKEIEPNLKFETSASADINLFAEDLIFEYVENSKQSLEKKNSSDKKLINHSYSPSNTFKFKENAMNFSSNKLQEVPVENENDFFEVITSTIKNPHNNCNETVGGNENQVLSKAKFFEGEKIDVDQEITDVFTTFSQESLTEELFDTKVKGQLRDTNSHEFIVPTFFSDFSLLNSLEDFKSDKSYYIDFANSVCSSTTKRILSKRQLENSKKSNTEKNVGMSIDAISQENSFKNISSSGIKPDSVNKTLLTSSLKFTDCEKSIYIKTNNEGNLKRDNLQNCENSEDNFREINDFLDKTPEVSTSKNRFLFSKKEANTERENNNSSPRSLVKKFHLNNIPLLQQGGSSIHKTHSFLIANKANISSEENIPSKRILETKETFEKIYNFPSEKLSLVDLCNVSQSKKLLYQDKMEDLNQSFIFKNDHYFPNNKTLLDTSQVLNNLRDKFPNQYSSKGNNCIKSKNDNVSFHNVSKNKSNFQNSFYYQNQEQLEFKKITNLENSLKQDSFNEFQYKDKEEISPFNNTESLYRDRKGGEIQMNYENYNGTKFNSSRQKFQNKPLSNEINYDFDTQNVSQLNGYCHQGKNSMFNDFISTKEHLQFQSEKTDKKKIVGHKLQSDINIEQLMKPNTGIITNHDKNKSIFFNENFQGQKFINRLNQPRYLNFQTNKNNTICDDQAIQYPAYPMKITKNNTGHSIIGCESKVSSKWHRYIPDTSAHEYKMKRNEWLNEVVKRERETCNFRRNDLDFRQVFNASQEQSFQNTTLSDTQDIKLKDVNSIFPSTICDSPKSNDSESQNRFNNLFFN